jgi:membrane protease YdiL (CAAX protease family)
MNFIEISKQGRTNFMAYFISFVLMASTLIGLGQIPYSIALNKAGIPAEEWNKLDTVAAIELLGENEFLAYQLFPFAISLLALLFCVKYVLKRPILTIFTVRESFDWKRFFFSFFIWGGFLGLLVLLSVFVFGAKIAWNLNPETIFGLVLVSFFIVPLQTTFEDVLFRGFFLQGMGVYLKKGWLVILFTGLLFGLMHASNPEVELLGSAVLFYYIGTGLFLALITYKDNGLELGMGFHAMNNIFGSLILTNNWQVFQTDALWIDLSPPSFGVETILILAICLPLLLFIFSKKYNWKWTLKNPLKS